MKRATLVFLLLLAPGLAFGQSDTGTGSGGDSSAGPGHCRSGASHDCPPGCMPGCMPGCGSGVGHGMGVGFGPGGGPLPGEEPGFGHGGPGFGPGGGPLPGEGRRAHQMVEAFRLYRLTEYLALTETQTAKIYPKLAEMQRVREEHMEAMREKMDALAEMLEADKVQADKAAGQAREIRDLQSEHFTRMHALEGDLMGMLDQEQQAKYVIFESHFQKHLNRVARRLENVREDLGQVREGAGPGRRAPGRR
jgi:Skp family chaperone for outer membrane proteins